MGKIITILSHSRLLYPVVQAVLAKQFKTSVIFIVGENTLNCIQLQNTEYLPENYFSYVFYDFIQSEDSTLKTQEEFTLICIIFKYKYGVELCTLMNTCYTHELTGNKKDLFNLSPVILSFVILVLCIIQLKFNDCAIQCIPLILGK